MKNVRLLLIGLLVVLALAASSGSAPSALGSLSGGLGHGHAKQPSAAAAGPATGAGSAAARSSLLYAGWNFVPYSASGCAGARDGFAQLIDAGVLNIGWHHENQTKVWTNFDPDAPDVANDLEQLCPNQVIVVNVSAGINWTETP
jgi:hypothetical protein